MSIKAFDRYVPLGVNCEADWQLRHLIGYQESGFFANGVAQLKPLVSLIASDFAGIGQSQNLRYEGNSTLVRDTAHGYTFHWVGPGVEQCSDPNTESFIRNIGRLNYLAAKFRSSVSSDESIAFIYTCHDEVPFEPLSQVARLLEQQYGTTDFKIIVLQSIERYEPEWDHPRLVNRYLKRLAPWSDVADASIECWHKIFAEFPLK